MGKKLNVLVCPPPSSSFTSRKGEKEEADSRSGECIRKSS
jgi:hypothetical protein